MTTAEITVQYVNGPKEGQKTGTIKTTGGVYYRAFPDKLTAFKEGGTYKIEYETREYQGKEYHTVKRVLGTGNGVAQPVPTRSGTTAAEMAFMGIVGRTMQGTGKLPSYDAMLAFARDVHRVMRDGFKDEPKVEPPFDDPIDF